MRYKSWLNYNPPCHYESVCQSNAYYHQPVTGLMNQLPLASTQMISWPGLHNKHWPAGFFLAVGPVRASGTQLLLACTGHKEFVQTTHCHIMLARTIIQRADLFPHCRDHFVRNATRLTHRSEFPCYVGDIQPLTVNPTIPLVLI